MSAQFHLSLEVGAVEESADFFVRVLRASVTHRDESTPAAPRRNMS